jgi:2-polyprenyl-3-methyl-5-hydroxy-6-metoxy-1,4-benzoquinol methylase
MPEVQTFDRQVNPTIKGIRPDHTYRYFWARDRALSPVLDAACGVGYGSRIMADAGKDVVAVDIEPLAIQYGQRHYAHPHIHWITANLLDEPWGAEQFNTVVSFETLEHLEWPDLALGSFHDALLDGGRLLVSVPNEERMPFKAENFTKDTYPHRRHYTPEQFEKLLTDNGFEVTYRGSQPSKESAVHDGTHGLFLVYAAVKR